MRVKEKYYTQLKRPHITHFYNKCTPTHRCSLKKALLRPSTCCTVTVFNAGTLELLSQVGRKGQGVALKLLQQHKHPINSCRLKATQTDWLHAWWLITLCSCTLIWARTHTQHTLCSQAHWEDVAHTRRTYTDTQRPSHWEDEGEREQPYHLSWSCSNRESLKIKGPSSICYYRMKLKYVQVLLPYKRLIDSALTNGCVWGWVHFRRRCTVGASSGHTQHSSQWR